MKSSSLFTLFSIFKCHWLTQILHNAVVVHYRKDRRVLFRDPMYVHRFLQVDATTSCTNYQGFITLIVI
jgi:hypothetical protein